MINEAEIIVNRCGRLGCGIVAVFILRRQLPQWIREYAGSTPCEHIPEHDMSEWTRATIRRDVLILRALWTVGRSITPGLPSDPTCHMLADAIGWRLGDPAELSALPTWMHGTPGDVTWPTVILAARVAKSAAENWDTSHALHGRWSRVAEYLRTWSDRVH